MSFLITACVHTTSNHALPISEEAAIQIAQRFYKKKGGNLKNRIAYASLASGDENPYTSKERMSMLRRPPPPPPRQNPYASHEKMMSEIKKKLPGRTYWIVRFDTEVIMPGSIAVVFIDEETGEILGMYDEE